MTLPSLTKNEKLILASVVAVLTLFLIMGGGYVWRKSQEYAVKETTPPQPQYSFKPQQTLTISPSLPSPTPASPSPVVNAHAPTDSDSGVAKEIKKEDPPTLLYTNDLGDKSLNLERKLVFFVMHDQQEKTEKVLSLAEVENKNLVEKFILIIQVENIVTINVYPEYTPNTQKTQVYYTWRK